MTEQKPETWPQSWRYLALPKADLQAGSSQDYEVKDKVLRSNEKDNKNGTSITRNQICHSLGQGTSSMQCKITTNNGGNGDRESGERFVCQGNCRTRDILTQGVYIIQMTYRLFSRLLKMKNLSPLEVYCEYSQENSTLTDLVYLCIKYYTFRDRSTETEW